MTEIRSSAEIEDVSDTALWVAVYRALETERPDAAFRDPLARTLAGDRGERIARKMKLSKMMAWIMTVRTTAIDQLVLEAIRLGVDTVLNIGAGMDTRPYRMDLPPSLRWIELDFKHLIDFKNEKLANEKPGCKLERVAMDLAARPARQKFFADIQSNSKSVLLITEGVIPYLTAEAVEELMDDFSKQSHFKYWIQDFYQETGGRNWRKRWGNKLKRAPMQFHVENREEFFRRGGWVREKTIYAADETQRIGRNIPLPFPWNLVMRMVPKRHQGKYKENYGFDLLKSTIHSASNSNR